MQNNYPVYCGYFLSVFFFNILDWLNIDWEEHGVSFPDVGLKKVIVIVKKWLNDPSKDRKINQYTFNNIEVDSLLTKDQLISFATYIWMLGQVKVVNIPSDDLKILSCWECTTGAKVAGSDRYRTSFSGRYLYNYDITGRIMLGTAKYEWSHLCQNSLCVRPSHLVDEDHAINMSRNKCPGNIYNPFTQKMYILCKHNPRCLHVHYLEHAPLTIDEYIHF